MSNISEKTLWGIHGGEQGIAHKLFIENNLIALGWLVTEDLTQIKPDRDSIKSKLIQAYPDRKKGFYPVVAGQTYRFLYEVKEGDYIAYPSKIERQIYLGEIKGPYHFDNKKMSAYPHHRSVKWIKHLPRTDFSQGALYEVGSAMTFFQIKNYADEFLKAIVGQIDKSEIIEDESIAYIAEDIEDNTRDFIIKKLAQELKGHAFADFISHLLNIMGYKTRVSPEGPDGGIDIIAHKDELGFEPPLIKVQVKSSEGSISEPMVSQLYGKVDKAEYGMYVTLGTFTNQAKTFARNKNNLRAIDGEELVSLIFKFYEKFDSKYKALLPLRMVYVPEPLEE